MNALGGKIMELNITKEGDITIAAIAGRLDNTNYIGVEKRLTAIIDNDERNLLFDCTELEYLSSVENSSLLLFPLNLRDFVASWRSHL
jgi:anti-anti-sigma regulatory factor